VAVSEVKAMRSLLDHVLKRRQFRFIIAGATIAGFFFVFLYLLVSIGLPAFTSSLLAYLTAFGLGYLVQRNWSFRARHSHVRVLPRYLLLQAGCALISGLSAQTATTLFYMPPLPTSILNTVLMGLISYIVSLNWVFPDDQEVK
jgi:putative flippase GtrA